MADACHILITGGTGQIGRELLAAKWPEGVVLHAPTRAAMDMTDAGSVAAAFAAVPYAVVINTAAYTAVDKAESEVAAAFAANAMGPALLAEATARASIPMIQVSTDYVFDGTGTGPYSEDAPVAPLNVYGASKLAGELAVRSGNPRSIILRTAWVLSPHRSNFARTMLRLAAERPVLRVVEDQHGCPTSARDIACVLQTLALRLVADPTAPTGVYHFVNEGETTWAGLAREVLARSADCGGVSAAVEGIPATDYPTPARRPANSRLSTGKLQRDYGIVPRPWQVAVAEIVTELNSRDATA